MQDRAIADIGKLELLRNKDLELSELLSQEPFPNRKCKMLLIEFEENDGNINFKKIGVDDVDENNYIKYAYRKGSGSGGDVTFTSKCGDFSKKLKTLINIQFPRLIKLSEEKNSDSLEFLKKWEKSFLDNYNEIQRKLQKRYEDLEKQEKKRSAYTLTIEIDDQRKYLLDFATVESLMTENKFNGNFKKYNVSSKGEYSKCSICHDNKEEVYGFGSPFKYATVNKPGLVSGFFKQKNNWVNYPICKDCSIEMELGKNYLVKHLTKSFFGREFYLVPKPVVTNDTESLKEALNTLKDIDYEIEKSEVISSNEDFLLKKIGKAKEGIFTLNLLFFEEDKKNKSIKIKLMMEEIPPSRFRKLFIDVPKIISEKPSFLNLGYSKTEKLDLKFSFKLINLFFKDDFYEITHKIFIGRKISQKQLHTNFMKVIRSSYKQNKNNNFFLKKGKLLIAKTYLLQSYFQELNLINYDN